MNSDDFKVSEDLFKSKPTEDEYLLSAQRNQKGNIDLVYIDINSDGEITIDKSEVYDNKHNRKIIGVEKLDTYMKIMTLMIGSVHVLFLILKEKCMIFNMIEILNVS